MAPKYIPDGMLIHFLVLGTILAAVLFLLHRRQLLFWLSAGFWAWASLTLYFFIAPLIQYLGDPTYLETRILATEGWSRMIWVTFFVAVGIIMFFWGYLKGRPGKPRFGLGQRAWPTGAWIVIIMALFIAGYSLIVYRGAFGIYEVSWDISEGKYSGNTTGYWSILYYCANLPIILLIVSRRTRILGFALAGFFLAGKMADAHDRFGAVSLALAVVMALMLTKPRKWPSPLWIAPVLVFTLLLQARGHVSFSEFQKSGSGTMIETSRTVVQRGDGVTMQATLYLKSYLHDKAGYTYGLPFVSGVLFGALPRKYFPWKDWMTEGKFKGLFRAVALEPMMYGSKSAVIGDLYGFGGVFAVAVGMWLLGLLTRKLDGWLAPQASLLVRAMGVVWLSCLWLMIGSGLVWSANVLYSNVVPFLGLVLCAKIFGTGERLSRSEPRYLLQR